MSVSHLPVERYTGVTGESDEWRAALARRTRRSRHFCRLGERAELREAETNTGRLVDPQKMNWLLCYSV